MLRNYPYGFDNYLVNVKTLKNIVQIFVAFSKKLNFSSFIVNFVIAQFAKNNNIKLM